MNPESKISQAAQWLEKEVDVVVLKELAVRAVEAGEMDRVRAVLLDEHYLGAGREVGRTLVQIVQHRERWVAILVWGPAALRLIDREEWIGWTHQQRAQRLGLVVQNRRFLVLAETRMPNLASRALGLAVRALPTHWEAKHGYRPLLAETFTDIESFAGTCYKAAGWEPCGMSKGFGREHRADFYREHQRPKKLWLKPLSIAVIWQTAPRQPRIAKSKKPLGLIAKLFRPGPARVRLLVIVSCPLVSVTAKLMVSPDAASAMACRSVPGPLSARLVTVMLACTTAGSASRNRSGSSFMVFLLISIG